MKSIKIISFLILSFQLSFAQKFWLTTYEFPGREKTGITITPNNNLVVSLTNGVIRSSNAGNKFDTVLQASSTFCIFSDNQGNIFAGGKGKIFKSINNGQTWDSVNVNSTFPISKIIQNSHGHLFAITGGVTNNGFEGDGVFFSNNLGLTWEQRNNGLGIYTCIEHIAIDKNDRIYIATADELVTGNGGLFVSEDNGLQWEHIDIQVDGKGVIDNQIKIANTWGISVSKSDSVYFSFSGTAVNVGVRLNTVKHINQIKSNSFWTIYSVVNSPTWWFDKLLNKIHFAQNGDKYSSVSGSINIGGTFFNKNLTTTWQKINWGLGVDINGIQNIQHFSESSNGKIYMVQTFDERVYYADTSLITAIPEPESSIQEIVLYPNPVIQNNEIWISATGNSIVEKFTISLFDGFGKEIIKMFKPPFEKISIRAPRQPGIYLLLIENQKNRVVEKIIVH